jgi:segregation and condensation protein B
MEGNMTEEINGFDEKEAEQAFDEQFDSEEVLKSAGDDKEEDGGDDSEFEDKSAFGPSSADGDFIAPGTGPGAKRKDNPGNPPAADARDKTSLAESDLTEGVPPTLESVIEAILFASDESVNASRLAKIAETSASQVRRCVEVLNERYKAAGSAFQIEQIAGGYQMLTLSCYDHWLKKLVSVRGDSKLSNAALETLAIISYKQPIIRADIEAIRGVQCGEVIRSLMYKGLVKIVGRAEILGRPMQYGTTKKFLEVFGLNSLKDLPKVDELKKPEQ